MAKRSPWPKKTRRRTEPIVPTRNEVMHMNPGGGLECDLARAIEAGVHQGILWTMLQAPTLKTRCGYARIPAGHPWATTSDAMTDMDDRIDVHGGVTYTARSTNKDGSLWVGFDTGHAGDACDPSLPNLPGTLSIPSLDFDGAVIRTADYVREQIISMCEQIKEAE